MRLYFTVQLSGLYLVHGNSVHFHLVMSLPAMTFGDRFCFSRKGGVGEVGGCRRHGRLWDLLWKRLGWLSVSHCCPPMHKRVKKTVLVPCMAPIFGGEAFIPVWVSVCRLSAVTIASSLMGGCGLSHKHVEDGCKSTCVEFGGWKSNRSGDMVSLIRV